MARSSLGFEKLLRLARTARLNDQDYEAMIFRFKNEFAKDDVPMAQVDAFNPDGSMSRGKSLLRL
jgi:hypothetical protein